MKMLRSLLLAALTAALMAPALAAEVVEGDGSWCGTGRITFELSRARDEFQERRLRREAPGGVLRPKSPTIYQDGQIAIIENDGSLLSLPNAFDLQGASMQFLRRPKGMSAVRSHLDFKSTLGTRLELGDDASVLVELPEGFAYPFGDEVYTEAWVNSNGSLTFGEAAPAAASYDVSSFLNGPPRIAPFYADLDPSAATGEGGVYLNFLPGRVRLTWLDVPAFGTTNRNTVQVTLFTTGRVTFVFGDTVELDRAVVGVQAFSEGQIHLMDYDEELPFRPQRVAIAEEFSPDSTSLNDLAISRAFFQGFQDRYSHLVIWLDFPYVIPGAFAFHQLVKNEGQGYGRNVVDRTAFYGSPGNLESYVQMGSLARYHEDPNRVFRGGLYSTLGLIGHEAGHRWLAFARFRDSSGQTSDRLLGRQKAHWSFMMHSAGSFDEGNWLVDHGDGTFTTTDKASTRYSELDQYLMGLRPASAVPDFFYVTSSQAVATDPPRLDYTFAGTRHDVSVDDVIAVHGPRAPASGQAPRTFRMAFVLVTDGGPPSPESIAQLDLYRHRWISKFQEATDNRATVATGLFPK